MLDEPWDEDEALPWTPDIDNPPFTVTSGADGDYNCLGWALGSDDKYVWPVGGLTDAGVEWPGAVERELTVAAFTKMFHEYGWEPCEDGDFRKGYVRIVLYAKTNKGRRIPAHAARQVLDAGTTNWTSKMGDRVDVCHPSVDDVNSRAYGRPVGYFEKRGKLRSQSPDLKWT